MLVPITEVIASRDDEEFYRGRLAPGEYIIGRESECDIQVDAAKVSRKHARLELRYSEWLIEDLKSSNGTWVGEEKIHEPTLVFPRQKLRVGNVQLRLRRLESVAKPGETLAPQKVAVLRFLPPELRDHQRYRVHRMIAMGGMGAVLEAEDTSLRRKVAMKVLLDVDSPGGIARFVEEAQITAQLAHPNIVPIYDLNVNERDNPFFTMKLLEGAALRTVLNALRNDDRTAVSRYAMDDLVRILGKICDALAFAHSKGVVHRDLKPDNVMLGEFGEVAVMDWGLAKAIGRESGGRSVNVERRTTVSSARKDAAPEFSTSLHGVIGTPHFMAPEQAAGDSDAVDGRSDVYALGAILYEMLTLHYPVEGRDSAEILKHVCEGRVRPPREAVLGTLAHWPGGVYPAELATVAMKALAIEKKDRHQSVREFQIALRQAFAADRSTVVLQARTTGGGGTSKASARERR